MIHATIWIHFKMISFVIQKANILCYVSRLFVSVLPLQSYLELPHSQIKYLMLWSFITFIFHTVILKPPGINFGLRYEVGNWYLSFFGMGGWGMGLEGHQQHWSQLTKEIQGLCYHIHLTTLKAESRGPVRGGPCCLKLLPVLYILFWWLQCVESSSMFYTLHPCWLPILSMEGSS